MRVWLGILLALGLGSAATAAARQAYAPPKGTCDGYPRLDIGMARGFCAGLVAGPSPGSFGKRTMRLPRNLVTVDGGRSWIVADLGAWDRPKGTLWRLTAPPGRAPVIEPLLTGLSLPHGLAAGPDGLVYVGEMQRIFRFDPRAPDPKATIETVIGSLPANRLHDNRHPLSAFIFAPDGALIVNVGAPSDQCLDTSGKPVGSAKCSESEGAEPTAVLRRYAPLGGGRWSQDYTVFAWGLRNSVALAVHPSGTIWQGENSYDTGERWTPFDEVNRIEAGAHYGWPYCADVKTPMPGWVRTGAMDCQSRAHAAPTLLLAPHAAPLALTWYEGPMFPQLKGMMLMTWHGYRSTGGRVVAYRADETGAPMPTRAATYSAYPNLKRPYGTQPAATPLELTPGWGLARGVRPQGTPAGLAVAPDGSIWVADDKNGAIIRIAADRP